MGTPACVGQEVTVAFIQGVISFFYYLWKGQLSLTFTYWVVGFIGNFTVFIVPLFFIESPPGEMTQARIVHLAISATYYAFSAVCVGRAVGLKKRPKTWPF